MTLLLLFGHFSRIYVFWCFFAILILGLGYIGAYFEIFFGQNFEIWQNWLFWSPTPPNQKHLSSQWLRHQKNDTFFYFLTIFRNFGYFGVFWQFCAYIIEVTDLRFFFCQNFEICQNWLFWSPNPPNQKHLSSQSLSHQKKDTFVTIVPFFAIFGILMFFGHFGPRL